MSGRWLAGVMLAWGALPAMAVRADAPRPPSPEVQAAEPDLIGGCEVLSVESRALFLWGARATILRSEDGLAWHYTRTRGSADLSQLAANETGSVIVAAGSGGAVLRSVDAGRTWSAARTPATESDLVAVVSAGDRVWIAAGESGLLLRSVDDGRRWTAVKSPLTATLRTLSLDVASGRILVGGESGLLGFSSDRGESWQVTAIDMPEPVTPITAIHRFGGFLLATSTRGRFLVSGNDATSWDLLQSTSRADITGAASDAARGIIVLAGDNGDIVRSTDGGQTWEVTEALLDEARLQVAAIRFDTRSGDFLAMARGGVLAKSADGASWQRAAPDLRGEPRGLFQDSHGAFIAYGGGGTIARSTSDLTGWTYTSPLRQGTGAAIP